MFVHICTFMYAYTHPQTHRKSSELVPPCGRCYWCNQSTEYFEVRLGFTSASALCVEGTGVTSRREHLGGGAEFFRPFSMLWQSVIIDVYTYKEMAQGWRSRLDWGSISENHQTQNRPDLGEKKKKRKTCVNPLKFCSNCETSHILAVVNRYMQDQE